jgi:hypothetical protein
MNSCAAVIPHNTAGAIIRPAHPKHYQTLAVTAGPMYIQVLPGSYGALSYFGNGHMSQCNSTALCDGPILRREESYRLCQCHCM